MAAEQEVINRKWVMKQLPEAGKFVPDRDVELVEEKVDLSEELPEGTVILKTSKLSVDAFVRTMMDDGAFHGTLEVGSLMPAFGYGTVIKSSEGAPPVGAIVRGRIDAQTYPKVAMSNLRGGVVETPPGSDPVPDELCMTLLGKTTGLTAYVGMFAVLRPPTKGETVVVSAASGAVGSIAAQMAKIAGARVVGIAGGAAKCQWLKETLGLDEAIDYKDASQSLGEQLDKVCPDKINFFFDNVGGETLDEVLLRLAPKARIVICGAISQYERDRSLPVRGPSNYLKLAEIGASMAGFVVIQYLEEMKEGDAKIRSWYTSGQIKDHVTRKQGFEEYPGALQGLFTGQMQLGKTLVEIA